MYNISPEKDKSKEPYKNRSNPKSIFSFPRSPRSSNEHIPHTSRHFQISVPNNSPIRVSPARQTFKHQKHSTVQTIPSRMHRLPPGSYCTPTFVPPGKRGRLRRERKKERGERGNIARHKHVNERNANPCYIKRFVGDATKGNENADLARGCAAAGEGARRPSL